MILLSSVVKMFKAQLLDQYQAQLLPSHHQALNVLETCRTSASPLMEASCDDCQHPVYIPHSCGHRLCSHCQQHESQQWLEHQLKKQVPADYFLITFTVPAELRSLCWQHQRTLYGLLFNCAWATLSAFSQNDKALQGRAGGIAVLHTHSRRLDYHPHVHIVMPAAAIDPNHGLWREKNGKFLFSHKALAKVFRAKLLAAITQENLPLPQRYPKQWVVDCQWVGKGDKALVYLGRYLYRGVLQEKDILRCENGHVTFRYQDGKTKQFQTRTLPGAAFLFLLLRHTLPKGLRRARNYGFLHPNSKRLIAMLRKVLPAFDPQKLLRILRKRPAMTCPCCGGQMRIVKTRLPVGSLSIATERALE